MTDPALTPPAPIAGVEDPELEATVQADRRANLRGGSLRFHAAQGTVVNAVFLVLVNGLSFVKAFAVAHFVTAADFGIWGILVASLGVLGLLKDVGIQDRYIQQDEADQELAFQKAFTLELYLNAIFSALVLLTVPLLALAYGRNDLLAPGFVCALMPLVVTFQVPLWIHYRQMDYRRQRLLQSLDPVVSLAVTVVLAVNDAGYWSLIVGVLAGACTTAVASMWTSPYPVRLRSVKGTLHEYWSFSAPLFLAAAGSIAISQSSVLVGNAFLGIAGVGAIALAAQVSQLTDRVDQIVTGTLYPAICAVRDRRDLLYESFVKSNRLALMWGMPFGIALALFAAPLVHHVLGDHWVPAIPLLQVFGVVAGLNQVAFNWTAYLRALGDTKPIAVVNLLGALVFVVATVVCTALWDIRGFAYGVAIYGFAFLVMRWVVVARLFERFSFIRQTVRSAVPTVPGAAAVLGLRLLDLPVAGGAAALLELAVFACLTVGATWILERELLLEALGYLRGGGDVRPPPQARA